MYSKAIDPFFMEVTGMMRQEVWSTSKNLLPAMPQKGSDASATPGTNPNAS